MFNQVLLNCTVMSPGAATPFMGQHRAQKLRDEAPTDLCVL